MPLTGPLKWLFILAFVGIYPAALVWFFAPDSDIGKACFGALGYYLLLPFLTMLAVEEPACGPMKLATCGRTSR
jgi:hypothetical protein